MTRCVSYPPTTVLRVQYKAKFIFYHGLADDISLHCQVSNKMSPRLTRNEPTSDKVV
eukprot:CAMPEP_0201601068 /NCGR_PEP_ID=MMETSP0492-20130828/2083_1 /ASSEMBLY_ACC=CAM_ASM_000837 /TAXON_ID=420259 /ORGANISM="Thalassiosira gravida, Strain GMp14c1" /LENGTH=56 /DNA_ID=CAMNT_0048064139 /DNA_START=27 /DNA_END=197 /DNA_ORIENTATION=-